MTSGKVKKAYWKICDRVSNIPEYKLVFIFMLVSIAFWSSISGYLKIQRYHTDEWVYLQKAYSIKNGFGINSIYGIEGLGAEIERYIYSILIAPACLIKNISLRFRAIALINAISLSSSAIPVYLLSKEMLLGKKKRLLSVIIALTMPYMNYCASFMSEVVFIPIGLWIIYLNYMLIQFKNFTFKKNIQRSVILVFFIVLAWYTKNTGRVFIYIEILVGILAFIYNRIREIKEKLFRYMFIMMCIIVIISAIVFVILTYIGTNSFIQTTRVFLLKYLFTTNSMSPLYADATLYVVISFILAFCIIPIVYCLTSFKSFNLLEKLFLIWLIFLTIMLLQGVIRLSYIRYYNSYNGYNEGFSQIWFRYISILYMPILIIFFKAADLRKESSLKETIVLSLFMVIFWMTVLIFYKGAQAENAATYSMLYWVRYYGNDVDIHIIKILFSLIIACIIGGLIYVFANCPYRITKLFLLFWIPIQIFNNIESHKTIVSENSLTDTSIVELREYVLNHKNETFLLIDIDNGNNNSQSMWRGDAYLDTKNIIRYYPTKHYSADYPCDLNSFYSEYAPDMDITKVKYVILCSELTPQDLSVLTEKNIGNGQWYNLYELNIVGHLPVVQKVGE
ncbi:MAG: hypothetical protein E7276_02610 [Pseudobutyrivibrio sp.]|nr:hypothetical protein [Pseudobutyrivibrio sp.]